MSGLFDAFESKHYTTDTLLRAARYFINESIHNKEANAEDVEDLRARIIRINKIQDTMTKNRQTMSVLDIEYNRQSMKLHDELSTETNALELKLEELVYKIKELKRSKAIKATKRGKATILTFPI